MMKTCLFAILVLLMQPIFAASLMTHEKFVHLNYEDQRKIVVATMELIVEIEEKYEHQVKTSGYNEERFRRYTELIRKVSSVVFPEAHAAQAVRNERIGQYMQQLRTIIRQPNKCIYGGWPSSMSGNLCNHPSNGSFQSIYFSENNCRGINQISCNPAIFGFKHVGRGTLFCVSAGRSGPSADAPSDNTSRECMKKALAPSTDPNVSSPAERIANLVDGIRRNPLDSNALFDFLLKACACEERSPAISEHYHNYMRPHRTCFSILKMMSEVMPECSASISPMSEQQSSFLAHIRNSISQDEINSATPNTIDAVYGQVVSGFVSRPEYQSICGTTPGPTPRPGRCSAPDLELENGECCVPPQRPDDRRAACVPAGGIVVTSCTPPQIPNPAGGCMDPSGGSTTCTPPQIPNPAGGCMDPTGGAVTTCTPPQIINPAGGCMDPGGATACTPPQITNPAGGCMDPGGATACTPPQITNPAGGCMDPAGSVATCANGANNHPECNACTAPKVYLGESCRDACPEGVGERNPTTFACSEVCTDAAKEYVRATNSCQVKCVAPQTRNEAGICGAASSGHTIAVKSTIKDLNTTTITVTLDGGTTPIPGHTIIWFKKGTNITNLTFTGTNGTPAAVPDPVAGTLSTTGEEIADTPATSTNDTWDDPGTDETSIPASNDDLEFIAPRHTENYEVCARLVKISDRSLASSNCAIVQKKTAPAPTGGFNQGPQQMGPTRGGASDAIFRGIR